ncbi:hypothetical protein HFD88_004034 [Aspergillus terreus]|nr:hypothetical protein HFD88_004034 [Aspergillus terreus]
MYSSLEHLDGCLPVTAIKVLPLGGVKLILQGQGLFTRIIDEQNGKTLAQLKTFRRNNVHGYIIIDQGQSSTGEALVQIIAWGGDSLRLIDVLCSNGTSGDLEVSLEAASAEYRAPDWILAGCAPEPSGDAGKAYGVTAHNAVLGFYVTNGDHPRYPKSIHIKQQVAGVKTLLYSANAVSLSSSQVLVAAGTVFGEVIVWSCFLDEKNDFPSEAVGSIHHFFTGHEGSVFGVRISEQIALPGRPSARLLASCSDDRTVRVWDISDCEHVSRHDPSAYSTDGFELRSTGFGAASAVKDDDLGSESCIASAFGHKARIWNVHFLHTQAGSQNNLSLVSSGEDATCVVWDLTWDSALSSNTKFDLSAVTSYHLHAGKHIWSLDTHSTGSESIIYTGGADGGLKSFRIGVNETGLAIFPNRNSIITTTIDPEGTETAVDKTMKSFAFVAQDRFLATTHRGEIQICDLVHSETAKPHIRKETLSIEEDLRSFCFMSKFAESDMVVFAGRNGSIRLYNDKTREITLLTDTGRLSQGVFALGCELDAAGSPEVLYFLVSYPNYDKADLFTVTLSQAELKVQMAQIALPHLKHFNITCASLAYNNRYLVVGSAYGYLRIYRVTQSDTTQEALWYGNVHDREALTHVGSCSLFLDKPGELQEYFITCGRDGKYCIHEIQAQDAQDTISVKTVHRSIPPTSFTVQGVYVEKASQEILTYGFSGRDFIVWNESQQTEIARIGCGGSHRQWTFQPGIALNGSSWFLWFQGQFNALPIQMDAVRTLKPGGHGREIKTLSVSPTSEVGPIFVTGGEDTILRLCALDGSQSKCLQVINHHQTGLQEVGWSRDGRFLFTSGGMEEFHVWRVRSIPYFGLATNLECSSPMEDSKSELRVTSFDVLDVDEGCGEGAFLLCLTYSNSKLKIFHYSSSADGGHFTLLARGTYTSNCLTQARFMRRGSSLGLITASTDGYFTFWNLTPVIEPYYTISSVLRPKQPIRTITGTAENITCENRFQIHSNSIKTLEIVEISMTASLIVAGGDDNALTFSLLRTDFSNTEASSEACTVRIPDAHAACVSTLKVLEKHESKDDSAVLQLTVASSGNDQQVKIWSVEVDSRKNSPEGVRVINTFDRYTAVADLSSLDVIRDEMGVSKLIVGGVGIDVFEVQQD